MLVSTLTLGLLAGPLPAEAQQAGKVYRIGLLRFSGGPLTTSPILRWVVDGVPQPVGSVTIDVTITDNLTLQALYDLPCAGDLDGDEHVGASDLAQLLGSWGPCVGCPR